jgi:hypothetical protein
VFNRAGQTHASLSKQQPTTNTITQKTGAVLTHANLIADAAGTVALVDEWRAGDRHISYLPLAHIYERNNMTVRRAFLGDVVGCLGCWGYGGGCVLFNKQHTTPNQNTTNIHSQTKSKSKIQIQKSKFKKKINVFLGGSVGFYSGNVQELLSDAAALRPNVFVSVPRLWNRVYDRVLAQVRISHVQLLMVHFSHVFFVARCLCTFQEGMLPPRPAVPAKNQHVPGRPKQNETPNPTNANQ